MKIKEYLLQKYYKGIADYSPELKDRIIERADGKCEVDGCNKIGVDIHHLVGKRRVAWSGNLVFLCREHHGTAITGIHGWGEGAKLRRKLLQELQYQYYGMGFTEEEVRYLLGSKSRELY